MYDSFCHRIAFNLTGLALEAGQMLPGAPAWLPLSCCSPPLSSSSVSILCELVEESSSPPASFLLPIHQISIKTPNPKCRLYWCLLEFILDPSYELAPL